MEHQFGGLYQENAMGQKQPTRPPTFDDIDQCSIAYQIAAGCESRLKTDFATWPKRLVSRVSQWVEAHFLEFTRRSLKPRSFRGR